MEEEKKQLEALKAAFPDVDTEKGIYYCANNIQLYLKLLRSFAQREKAAIIEKHYESENWKSYIIEVHALKSASRTLGFLKLGDMSEKMQYSAEAKDRAYVAENHKELVDTIKAVEDAINKTLF